MHLPCPLGGRPPAPPEGTPGKRRILPGMRRVVVPVLGTAIIGLAFGAGLTGCASMDKALGQQQAIVTFKDGTPNSVRLQVRAACGKLPNVTPSPLPSGVPQSVSLSQVVYEVDHASNADKARLQECLAQHPSVQGLDFQDSTDIGA
jgi:hypothetical protein